METDEWEQFHNGDLRVGQVIYVERNSQRAIVLGAGGRMIRRLGEEARKEMGELFDTRVHLTLHVKVRPKWAEDPSHYRLWGLDFGA